MNEKGEWVSRRPRWTEDALSKRGFGNWGKPDSKPCPEIHRTRVTPCRFSPTYFDRDTHIAIGESFAALLIVTLPMELAGTLQMGTPVFSTPHGYIPIPPLATFVPGAAFGSEGS